MSKLSILLATATILAITGLYYVHTHQQSTEADFKLTDKFTSFIHEFQKTYSSLEEKEYRLSVFRENLKLIDEHNAKENETYTLGVNHFADFTYEEFKAFYLTEFPQSSIEILGNICEEPKRKSEGGVPDSVDWQASKNVQKVKNQGSCGSCWAFSATAALESAISIAKKEEPLDISEQELVDCSKTYGNEGCNGGLMHWAFNYIADNNINVQKDYPYKGRGAACQTDKIGKGKVTLSGCVRAEPSVGGLVNALAVQPVSVAFYVSTPFMFYRGGVYNPKSCNGEPNHGVLAVGYNLKEKVPFYKVKNSWGASWGEKGYFRIAQGKEKGTCTIAGNGFNFYPLA